MSAFATRSGSEQPNIAEPRYSELTKRIQCGELGAIEELSGMLSRGLKLLIGRRLPPQEIDDAVRETILAVVRGIQHNDLNNPECLMRYVRTVMLRHVADRVNTLAAPGSRDVDLASTPDGPSDVSYAPEQRPIRDEDVAIMDTVLRSLPDRHREILTRFYLAEQAPEQIMADMGLTPTQFSLIKSRAKAQFSARRRLFHSSGTPSRAGKGDRA